MGKVIATINLKGGVAKTTTTVGLAEFLASEFKKKVLVIDLDPQTNATIMLIGDEKWKELNNKDKTIASIFKSSLQNINTQSTSKKTLRKPLNNISLQECIQKNVSNVSSVKTLDLIPSSLDLIDIQEDIITIPRGKFHANTPIDILKKQVLPIIDDYDYILIDCPPNLGTITLNGLNIADTYIIPAIPDILSTYGIPQVISRIDEFSNVINRPIKPLGIVATRYREQSPTHRRILDDLKQEKDAPLFETIFIENDKMASAAEYALEINTLRQKWGYGGQYDRFYNLAKEIIKRCE